jgi:ATP-dependent helicase YprA (DUF1998 family)
MEVDRLRWIVDEIKEHGAAMSKMLIYCPTVGACSEVFKYLSLQCGDALYHQKIRNVHNRIVGVYTGPMDAETKEIVLGTFSQQIGIIRVVIATIAFGMGIDIQDIRTVVMWGIPKNALAYWQQVGRAGRDLQPAKAILYAVKSKMAVKTDTAFKDDVMALVGAPLTVAKNSGRSKCTQTESPESVREPQPRPQPRQRPEVPKTSHIEYRGPIRTRRSRSRSKKRVRPGMMRSSSPAVPSSSRATSASSSSTTEQSASSTLSSIANPVCFRSTVLRALLLENMDSEWVGGAPRSCSGRMINCMLYHCCSVCRQVLL